MALEFVQKGRHGEWITEVVEKFDLQRDIPEEERVSMAEKYWPYVGLGVPSMNEQSQAWIAFSHFPGNAQFLTGYLPSLMDLHPSTMRWCKVSGHRYTSSATTSS